MSSQVWKVAVALMFALLCFVIVRLAWVGDDAYITLRTIENWIHGHGITWNPGERVQTYTHPLWMLALAGGRWLSGEAFYTAIVLGAGCTLLAVLTLLRSIGAAHACAAALAMLIAARSFGDYATSGLENPLAYLLLALLCAESMRDAPRVFATSLLAALLATTRFDFGLIAGPAVIAAVRRHGLRASIAPLALGMSPFAAWSTFAAIYYGTPFPITAYAKAFAHGIGQGELLVQGLHYLRYLTTHEPVLVLVTASGIGLGLLRAELRCRTLALGALLYTLYIVKVGGDFMAGRFLTSPFVIATAIVGRWLAQGTGARSLGTMATCAALTMVGGVPAWLQTPTAEVEAIATAKQRADFLDHGILDERANYYAGLGLFSPQRSIPAPGVFTAAMRATGRTAPMHMLWGQVGRFGFEAGDLLQIVDPWLCDPLLMRLPVRGGWRIGHFKRALPAGYLESRLGAADRIHHEGLRRYAQALRSLVADPVLGAARLAALAAYWRGDENDLLVDYVRTEYRHPPRIEIPVAAFADGVPVGTQWFDDRRARVVDEGGIAIALDGASAATTLRVRVQPNVKYRIRFALGATIAGETLLDSCNAAQFLALPELAARYQAITQQAPAFFTSINGTTLLLACCLGLQQLDVPVPASVGAFDRVLIDTVDLSEFGIAAVGGLQRIR